MREKECKSVEKRIKNAWEREREREREREVGNTGEQIFGTDSKLFERPNAKKINKKQNECLIILGDRQSVTVQFVHLTKRKTCPHHYK